MQEKNSFYARELECENSFRSGGPYHMISTKHQDWLLYRSRKEFILGTNMLAVASGQSGYVILDDIQMNNHHHILGEGNQDCLEKFLYLFRRKMQRLQARLGNCLPNNWNIRVDATDDLKIFRNRVGYIDRNAYVARLDSTPNGYPWGSGNLFFNQNLWMMQSGVAWTDLSIEQKRLICMSHSVELPSGYRVLNGMILRSSFVDYRRTERLFNSANQYFSMLSKRGEADVEIARMLGEGIQLPNEEVFRIVGSWYPEQSLKTMDIAQRLEAARKMKSRLACSNKQIAQILYLPINQVEMIFPTPA